MGTTPVVAYCIPTCNPERAATAASRWHAKGYLVYLECESGRGVSISAAGADHVLLLDEYPGYSVASSRLAKLAVDGGADIVVFGGDDMDPDQTMTAQEIGVQYLEHFQGSLGVMQPTGDSPEIFGTDRICGSPWLGRDWVLRAYGGRGPLWPGSHQFFMDEELQNVAKKLGVLWQRPELTQKHHHWLLYGIQTKTDYQKSNDSWWTPDETLFKQRKAAGFPDHQPAPSEV